MRKKPSESTPAAKNAAPAGASNGPKPHPSPKKFGELKKDLERTRDTLRGRADTVSAEFGLGSGDAGDRAFRDEAQSRELSLAGLNADKMARVEYALYRMRQGTYGRCEMCFRKVPVARLEADPAVLTCIECQREVEQGAELPTRTIDLGDDETRTTEEDGGMEESVKLA